MVRETFDIMCMVKADRNLGGTLGFHRVHAYPHADSNADDIIPYALKGKDCIVYSVFRELGLDPVARPVMDGDFSDEEEEYYDDDDSDAGKDSVGYHLHQVVLDYNELEEGSGAYEKRNIRLSSAVQGCIKLTWTDNRT